MGLTENHLLNDEGGAWEPIGGWTDKPSLSPYTQPVCCENRIPNYELKAKYPRKEYLSLLDVLYQAIEDYHEAVDELQKLESMGPELTKVSENDVAIGEPRPEAVDTYNVVIAHYKQVIKKIEQQIRLVSLVFASVEVVDDENE